RKPSRTFCEKSDPYGSGHSAVKLTPLKKNPRGILGSGADSTITGRACSFKACRATLSGGGPASKATVATPPTAAERQTQGCVTRSISHERRRAAVSAAAAAASRTGQTTGRPKSLSDDDA